jgi:hypothetical protein
MRGDPQARSPHRYQHRKPQREQQQQQQPQQQQQAAADDRDRHVCRAF